MAAESFDLWFGNQSGRGGQVLVYQPTTNVSFNGTDLEQLAWMVTGANPGVWVRFQWSVEYGFLWIDREPIQSQQIVAADLSTSNQITLSHNAFGFLFEGQQAGDPAGTLRITEDAAIPIVNAAVTGITMGGTGTLAKAAAPNQNLAFTPVVTADLTYLISFGQYGLEPGDTVTPALLNPSGTVIYPPGVTAMTAVLDAANQWTITEGAPELESGFLTYRADVGIVPG